MDITDEEMRRVAEELQDDMDESDGSQNMEEEKEDEPGEVDEKEAFSDSEETKEAKFKRLAEPRVNKIISGITSLGKLSNRSSYAYTDEQVTKMFSAIQSALDGAKEKYNPQKKKNGGFSF